MDILKKSDQFASQLLNSYEEIGIVNADDSRHFPARDRMVKLLEWLDELLFPGFFGFRDLTNSALNDVTKTRVRQVMTQLTEDIRHCFIWEQTHQNLMDKNVQASDDVNYDGINQKINDIVDQFMDYLPQLRRQLRGDAEAIFEWDPAAKSLTEVILSYPGFQAIKVYRIAAFLFQRDVPLIPRLMTEIIHSQTGIDIHPGARIGDDFCIDHGTGIVVGETTVIGHRVKLYQGVTLGAFSKDDKGQRHPIIGDDVVIYANSTILGGKTRVGNQCVVGGNVWLTDSLPDGATIYVTGANSQQIKRR